MRLHLLLGLVLWRKLLFVGSSGGTTLAESHVAVQAEMWQMNFLARPSALQEINRNLQIDEDVLRWVVTKKRQHPANPNTHTIAKRAQRALDEHGVHLVDPAQQHVAPH